MGERWYSGNAELDGKDTRGWVLGHFIEDGDIRSTGAVEIKWGVHEPAEARTEWVTDDVRTTVVILIDGGPFLVELSTGAVELATQGDYVVWGPGIDHVWRAADRSVVLTVRWPSD